MSSRTTTIPQPSKELSQIMEMQSWLSDLNQNNLQDVTKLILDSPFSRSKELAPFLAEEVLKVVPLRSGESNIFVKLCVNLKKNESSGNSLAIFRQKLISIAITPKVDYNIHAYASMLFFLKKLVLAKVVEIWEVTGRIMSISPGFPNCKFLAACYFIPEARKSDNEVFEKIFEEAKNAVITEEIIMPYKDRFDELCENDFEKLLDLTEIGAEKGTIEYAILSDDVETLSSYLDSDNYVDSTIPESPFAPWKFIQWAPTLAEYAIFFGSTKCVKELLDRNAKRSLLTQYAVAGGHREAIRLCEEEGMPFHCCLRICAYFRRMDLFTEIMDKTEPSRLFKEINVAMCRAAEVDDIRMFIECCKSGTNINFQDEKGETPFFIASREGYKKLLQYIQTFKGVKKNIPNMWGKLPADI